MKLRVIAFVDHEIGYRILEKIISAQAAYGLELVAVVTTHDNGIMWWPGVSGLCQKNNIPLHRYEESVTNTLNYIDVDWYFLISWKYIVPPELINHSKHGAINLHYSLLPEYRGLYPVNWAIMEGKKKTGITYHLVNEKIDGGQVVCQKGIFISLSDTARSLQLRLDDLAYELFDELVSGMVSGSLDSVTSVKKSQQESSYKSQYDFIETNELDLNREYRGIDIFNLLRGKTFSPHSKNLYIIDPDNGKRIYIDVSLVADE
jgi:methionyl-tRNA formyltransferase